MSEAREAILARVRTALSDRPAPAGSRRERIRSVVHCTAATVETPSRWYTVARSGS